MDDKEREERLTLIALTLLPCSPDFVQSLYGRACEGDKELARALVDVHNIVEWSRDDD